jgi:histidine triad (HIT) family protein
VYFRGHLQLPQVSQIVLQYCGKGQEKIMDNCIFCKIIRKEIPSQVVFENDAVLIIRDTDPQAPTHLLALPKKHYAGVHQVPESEKRFFQSLFSAIGEVVKEEGLDEKSYRLVINFGEKAGQSVHHIHVHILRGRTFGWPPG